MNLPNDVTSCFGIFKVEGFASHNRAPICKRRESCERYLQIARDKSENSIHICSSSALCAEGFPDFYIEAKQCD